MSPDTSGNVSTGSRGTLALCWIVYGIIRVIFAVWMLGFRGHRHGDVWRAAYPGA